MKLSHLDSQIDSDSKLFFKILKDILKFIILLIPYSLIAIINLILLNTETSKTYFQKIFVLPFQILENLLTWFAQAKTTTGISLILILIFLIQILYLNNNEILINSLKTTPLDTFSLKFYTNITSIFLHGNLTHLLSNLISLNIFGRIVEKHFQTKTFLLFLISGLIANLISNLIALFQNNFYYSLGASGGIAGLIILAILLNPFQFTSLLIIPLPIFLVGWFLIGLDIIGLSNPSQINHLAHIGGYLALIILMFFIELKQRQKLYVGLIINLILLILLYVFSSFIKLPNILVI